MHTPSKYDVFISYRRDGGDDCAMWLKTKLELDGFHPYLDVEAHEPGDYTKQIDRTLHEVDHVIVLLTNHCLDRCVNEKDVVRREIATSLALHKNVVPVIKRGFTFPDRLPEDIQKLSDANGLPLENYYRSEFYTALLKALGNRRTYAPAAPQKQLSLTQQDWSHESTRCFYGGLLLSHISSDLRMTALIDPASRRLIIYETDARRVLCALDPLKIPFTQYQLVFGADERYLYLIRENNVLCFDMMRNAYVSAKETALPFAARRHWDNVYIPHNDAAYFFDYEGEAVHTCVVMSPNGTTSAFRLQNYTFGKAIASAQIAGQQAVITAHPQGKLNALFKSGKQLSFADHAQTASECLQSGKRFSDDFSRENLYWYLSGSNGVTNYTDIFRTQDGEHLHRIFHGSDGLSFTTQDTVIWYDSQRKQLLEEDFLLRKNRLILNEADFARSDVFYRRPPIMALYVYAVDAVACVALTEDAARFRLVLIDRAGQLLCTGEETPCPQDMRTMQLRADGPRLALSFLCDNGENAHTALFTAHIRENL